MVFISFFRSFWWNVFFFLVVKFNKYPIAVNIEKQRADRFLTHKILDGCLITSEIKKMELTNFLSYVTFYELRFLVTEILIFILVPPNIISRFFIKSIIFVRPELITFYLFWVHFWRSKIFITIWIFIKTLFCEKKRVRSLKTNRSKRKFQRISFVSKGRFCTQKL